jgi:hypothetical protein
MGSFAMMYMPSFIKIGSDIGKFIGENTEIHKHTDYTDSKVTS